MLLRDAVTTIAFSDADLDVLMAALRAYRTTAIALDVLSDNNSNAATTAYAALMNNIRTAIND